MSPEDIQNIFFMECEESLAAAESGLAACRDGSSDGDTINAIFRAVHSIKGGAGAFGYMPLQHYTHVFETLLSDVREGLVPVEAPLVDLMLRALDLLSDHVTAARDGGAAPDDAALLAELTAAQVANAGAAPGSTPEPAPVAASEPAPVAVASDDDDLDFDLDSLLDGLAAAPQAHADTAPVPDVGADDWHVHVRPQAGAMTNGGEPLLLLRELAQLGGRCTACTMANLPPIDVLDPAQAYLEWTFAMPSGVSREEVDDIFDFIGDDCQLRFGDEPAVPAQPGLLPAQAAVAAPPVPCPTDTAADAPAAAAAPDPMPQPVAEPPAPPVGQSGPVPAPVPVPAPAAQAAGPSIRIDLAKLDRLIDGVGELVIAQAMLAQRLQGTDGASCEELAMLETLLRDVQESAMSFRAQPIGTVFNRVPRLLRELASSTGKHVKLVVSGEATELDKTVIERLGEPLTHLIRNAVDHGIEDPSARLEAGKPVDGTLTLSAEHRAGRIVIRIADDGAGINREKVLAKAVEKGLVAPDAPMSDEDIDNLIFAPGFSTAAQVSSISGRGVGMDVVRQNVKELGGRITIESVPGQGTAFIMALPLTLAISDGMIVQVGDQTLVIPLAHVVESLRPRADEIEGLGTACRMLNIRGRYIPLVDVRDAVGASCSGAGDASVAIVVDTETCGRAALMVDAITDQRQFVIKSLDTHYRSVDGVAGATILGNGGVALILDVDGLVQSAVTAAEPLPLCEAA